MLSGGLGGAADFGDGALWVFADGGVPTQRVLGGDGFHALEERLSLGGAFIVAGDKNHGHVARAGDGSVDGHFADFGPVYFQILIARRAEGVADDGILSIVHGVVADKGHPGEAGVQSWEAVGKTDAQCDVTAFVEQVVVQVEAAVVIVPDDDLFGTGVEETPGAGVRLAGSLQLGEF